MCQFHGWIFSSPNGLPGKITTLRNGQIKEIACNSSGVKDANTAGLLSGVRPISAAQEGHCCFAICV